MPAHTGGLSRAREGYTAHAHYVKNMIMTLPNSCPTLRSYISRKSYGSGMYERFGGMRRMLAGGIEEEC